MSAVNVNYHGGEDLYLTVYHPSLNQTQVRRIHKLHDISTVITTNAGLVTIIGALLSFMAVVNAAESHWMGPLGLFMLLGGAVTYLTENAFWSRRRFDRMADNLFLLPNEVCVSVVIPRKQETLQRKLFHLAVAVRDKKTKADSEMLYKAIVEYQLGEVPFSHESLDLMMEAL